MFSKKITITKLKNNNYQINTRYFKAAENHIDMPHKKLFSAKIIIWFVIFLTVALIVTKMINMDIPIETGILGTMYTFFYGLFINSLFKLLDEKYLNFRVYLGDLIGKAQTLYNIALLTANEKFIKNTRIELVNFIRSFNTLPATKYYLNQHHINKLYNTTKDLKVRTRKDSTHYSMALSSIDGLSVTREKLEIFGSKHINKETKIIFISTTILYILVIAFITFAKANFYMNLVGILLIGMVIFITILMLNLDELSYGLYFVKTKNLEELIDMFENKTVQTEEDLQR